MNSFAMDSGGMVSWLPRAIPKHANSMQDFGPMGFADPMQSENVLQDFDFDSFLHDGDTDPGTFDFNASFGGMEAGGEIGAE